jgi:hypothetical protein
VPPTLVQNLLAHDGTFAVDVLGHDLVVQHTNRWIENDLSGGDGLFVMPEAMRQQPAIDQSVGVSRPLCDDLLKVRVGIGVATCFNQAAAVGFLQREICGIDGGVALPGELLGAGEPDLHGAVDGIQRGGALKWRENIRFAGPPEM